jgi:iron complex outermembrane receptor protein
MQLKRNLLSVALASATMMLANAAYAQSTDAAGAATDAGNTDANQLDTIVVTGIRKGIQDSIDTKKNESTISEAVSSEDIGKLPDQSIADSLARLPGLTAQRFGGRPQEINIRGFAGDFSTALLNGTEQASLGNNRGVEFDQYPSELTSQVVVHKTTEADLVGQGLSGTVDIRTVRPLSFDKRVIAVNARASQNQEAGIDSNGQRYSISYIDQFRDRTVGLALGYAYMSNPQQGRQEHSWVYDGNGAPTGSEIWAQKDENKRGGFMGTLEWKPNDSFHSVLDVFYSRFNKDTNRNGLQFSMASTGTEFSDSGTAMAGTADIGQVVLRNDYDNQHDKLFSLNWNNELQINDHWSMTANISTSSARRKERILETYGARNAADTATFAYNDDGYYDFDFGTDYADPDNFQMRDPGGWGWVDDPLLRRAQAGYLKDFTIHDELSSARLDFERSFDTGFISAIDFGGNITERRKSRASVENTLCITQACNIDANIPAPLPIDGYGYRINDFGFFGLPSLIYLDANSLVNDGFYYLIQKENKDIANKNWEVDERAGTFYVQADIDADLGSAVTLKGNIGVQAVSVDQSSTGYATFVGNPVGERRTDGTGSTEYLPSLNLAFGLPADQHVRFGAGRQMARPRMDDLRASADYGIDTSRGIWSGSGGNPLLKPWIADAYDLSYEKYFGDNKGYVSAAYFYKKLKTYIYNQTVPFDFTDFVVPPGTNPADLPFSTLGEFTQPQNGEGGTIKGLELAVSIPFGMLWAPLEGFGFQGSYSDTKSAIHPNGPGTTDPLPGLSKYVSNATLYYERFGFSARVSRRTRSSFVGEFEGFGGDRERHALAGEKVVDAQIGYSFQSGPLQNLSLVLQVNNLTNEPSRQTVVDYDDRFSDYFEYGRTWMLGASYKF